jgi:hypothetical protein
MARRCVHQHGSHQQHHEPIRYSWSDRLHEVGSGTITYDGSTFTESTSNNGTIGNVLTLTLTTDIWAPTLAVGTNVTVNNLPAGLTANITRVSNTVATLGLAGNATSHINAADIANLEVVFADAAFNALPAAQIANATKSDIVINFSDNATAVLTYSAGTFTESVANNGTITNSVTVTISGGATFGASLTAGVDCHIYQRSSRTHRNDHTYFCNNRNYRIYWFSSCAPQCK